LNSKQQAVAIEYALDRVPYSDLIRVGLDPCGEPGFVTTELREALASHDRGSVECMLALAYRHELLNAEHASLLAALLLESWHHSHEDLAHALERLRDPATVDILARAAVMKHDYLAYDDSHAFARKCAWALADIGTPAARSHLERLAHHADPELAAYAQERLANWESELGRKAGGEPTV